MGADSGHHYCTHIGDGGGGRPDDHAGKIFRPAATGRARIGPAKAATAANLGRWIFVFSGHFRLTHSSFPTFLDPLNHFRGPFLQIHHRLKDTAKTNSADCWIEFSGHHSNLWTKVRVLMCSWCLGLSIDMWFVNFGRRLVSFPFLGCFG